MTPARSRCSRVWRPCASVRACTSARPSSSGLHHLVYEIVDNSIDEALAGYCSHIELTIEPGDIICVSDNGRGIPVDMQPQTGKSALEVVFTVLHAGGKFGGGGYKVSGGLHGVGASVVNALSEWLEVNVHKNGKIYQMKFSRGEIDAGHDRRRRDRPHRHDRALQARPRHVRGHGLRLRDAARAHARAGVSERRSAHHDHRPARRGARE